MPQSVIETRPYITLPQTFSQSGNSELVPSHRTCNSFIFHYLFFFLIHFNLVKKKKKKNGTKKIM